MATIKSLLELIDRFTPELRKAFLASVQDIKDSARIGDIVKAIERGDITAAVNAIGLEPAAFRPLTAGVETAFEQGGIFTAAQFQRPVGGAAFRFDVRNSRAEAWLRDYSSTAITRITDEQISLVQQSLMNGMNAGVNPRTMALDIIGRVGPNGREGGIIGLNAPQERYLANARRELENLDANYFNRELRDRRFDPTVRKAISSGTPLTQTQIDQLSTRYSDNLLQWRGETIARDQSITALNQSQNEAAQQLVDSGAADPRDITREWDSAGDNRTRETHRDADGQKVGMNEPFILGTARLMYPGDSSLGAPPEETINCRCTVRLRVDYIAAYKRRANTLPAA
jgi:hypothetical protein